MLNLAVQCIYHYSFTCFLGEPCITVVRETTHSKGDNYQYVHIMIYGHVYISLVDL